MEKLTWRRHLTVAGFVLAGGAALAGCADTGNYDGTGNEFTVRGPIKDVTGDMVEIAEDELEVLRASGRATEWFDKGYGQELTTSDVRFHDRYEDPREGGFWSVCGEEVIVGHVVDVDGTAIPIDGLDRGDYVKIDGTIRDERRYAGKSGCVRRGAAVFTEITVIQNN